ncbi:hypothetical protein, partial [Escherichia coli]|uniref:hypothetical protein n=1 Tax=Escherichia coli TaxID=562 RepID=UPI001BE41714
LHILYRFLGGVSGDELSVIHNEVGIRERGTDGKKRAGAVERENHEIWQKSRLARLAEEKVSIHSAIAT